MFHEWRREGYLVSTDPGRLNLGVIHSFLKGSYWARGVPLGVVGPGARASGALWLHASAYGCGVYEAADFEARTLEKTELLLAE